MAEPLWIDRIQLDQLRIHEEGRRERFRLGRRDGVRRGHIRRGHSQNLVRERAQILRRHRRQIPFALQRPGREARLGADGDQVRHLLEGKRALHLVHHLLHVVLDETGHRALVPALRPQEIADAQRAQLVGEGARDIPAAHQRPFRGSRAQLEHQGVPAREVGL